MKMQKEWRIAPENDDFALRNGHLFCNSRHMDQVAEMFGDFDDQGFVGIFLPRFREMWAGMGLSDVMPTEHLTAGMMVYDETIDSQGIESNMFGQLHPDQQEDQQMQRYDQLDHHVEVTVTAHTEFAADEAGDLALAVGDVIVVTAQEGEWWTGYRQADPDTFGTFPSGSVDVQGGAAESLSAVDTAAADTQQMQQPSVAEEPPQQQMQQEFDDELPPLVDEPPRQGLQSVPRARSPGSGGAGGPQGLPVLLNGGAPHAAEALAMATTPAEAALPALPAEPVEEVMPAGLTKMQQIKWKKAHEKKALQLGLAPPPPPTPETLDQHRSNHQEFTTPAAFAVAWYEKVKKKETENLVTSEDEMVHLIAEEKVGLDTEVLVEGWLHRQTVRDCLVSMVQERTGGWADELHYADVNNDEHTCGDAKLLCDLLKDGSLSLHNEVWMEGWEGWTPLGDSLAYHGFGREAVVGQAADFHLVGLGLDK